MPSHALPYLRFADWSARTPYVTRHMILTVLALFLISFFTSIGDILANCPAETLFGLQREFACGVLCSHSSRRCDHALTPCS